MAPFGVMAQQDSLINLIESQDTDTSKIDLQLNLAWHWIGSKRFDEADSIIESTLSVSTELDYQRGLAGYYYQKGLLYFRILKPYDQVSTSFLNSLRLYDQINDSLGKSKCQLQLGLIQYLINNYAEAVKYFEEGIVNCGGNGRRSEIMRYLAGICYSELGQFDRAERLLNESLLEYAAGDPEKIVTVRAFIGKLYFNQKRYQECISELEDALIEYPRNSDSVTVSPVRAFLSAAYLQIGNIEKTIQNGEFVLNNVDVSSGLSYWLMAASSLHQAYSLIGRNDKAYSALLRLTQLSDSVKGTRTRELLTLDKAKYEFDKELLREKAEQDLEFQLRLREKNRQRDIVFGLGILALLLAVGFYARWRFVKNAKNLIESEKERSDELLLNILPAEVAEELKKEGRTEARDFDMVSILFTDFKEFTQASEKLSPSELVEEINVCFEAFDRICEKFGIEKIKTIGDSYMAAGGIPVPDPNSVKGAVMAGIYMQEFIRNRYKDQRSKDAHAFEMRVGIHTGPVVAGIVGVKKFQYDLWGDTVNTASRMESSGEIDAVNVSQVTYDQLKSDPELEFEHRGKVEAKGKGEIDMYFVRLRSI